MNTKKYGIVFLAIVVLGFVGIAGATYYTDPYIHYHAPYDNVPVTLDNERYINDGISKNLEYTALITGTSMTKNFKTSELDALFDVDAIKIAFGSGSYLEIDRAVQTAIEYNAELQLVVRGLDLSRLNRDKDFLWYEESFYPWYLYDDCIWNDVQYLFNVSVFFDEVVPLLENLGESPDLDFDTYQNWNDSYTFSAEAVLSAYTHETHFDDIEQIVLTEEEKATYQANLDQNVVQTIADNPDIDFYYFLPPYSICYWDEKVANGYLEYWRELETMLIESLLPYENCYLYSFNENTELITDLNNYKDVTHYSEDVNSWILENMYEGIGLLTEENYQEYLDTCYEFYANYDYEIFSIEEE